MKTTTIPAGYRVTVVSWENDADHYKTKVLEGLTEQEARFVADFASLFKSKNNHGNRGIGNMYEPSSKEMAEAQAAVKAVVARHQPLPEGVTEYFQCEDAGIDAFGDEEDDGFMDGFTEYAYELGLSGGDFYTRVMESIKVEHIPEQIHLSDVTAEFVK